MRVLQGMLVLLVGIASWACAPTCKPGEVKSGDRCVQLRDAALDGEMSTVEADDGDAAAADVTTGSVDNREDAAGPPPKVNAQAAVSEAGSGTDAAFATDSSPIHAEAGSSADTAVAEDGSPEAEAPCTSAACMADACHPNPCGHGTCNLSRTGAALCECEPHWTGNGVCNVNTNATLSALTVSSGALFPAFKPDVFEYSVHLPLGSPEASLTATAAVPEGTALRVDGDVAQSGAAAPLRYVALNKTVRVQIQVSAGAGKVETYTVTLRRTLALQATIKAGTDTRNAVFGNPIQLSGNLLLVSAEHAASRDGVRYALNHLYVRQGTTWLGLENHSFYEGKIRLGDRWIAHVHSKGVAVHTRTGLGTGRDTFRFNLAGEANEAGFGRGVAFDGDTLVVRSDSRLHFYNLEVLDAQSMPQQTVVPLASTSSNNGIALSGDLLVVGAGSTSPPIIVRRTNGKWAGSVSPFPGQGSNQVSVHGGVVAVADLYACVWPAPCAGSLPQLNVYPETAQGWASQSVVLPVPPDVPGELDPSGFGVGGIAQGESFVVVGAPAVRSRRAPVAMLADPFVPQSVPSDGLYYYGGAYIFVRKQSGWFAEAILSAPEDADPERQPMGMGMGASYSNGLLAVSAHVHGPMAGSGEAWRENTFSGAVYIFGPDCSQLPAGAVVPGC